ncbi:hypothetical protein J4433_00145 [Candidatus Pacearchaeota archaeon]|nr:hypothetical protein [Candidatus Pacearchaeota archaeon]
MKNKKAMAPLIVVGIILLVVFGLFFAKFSGYSIIGENKENDVFVDKISTLKPLNLSSVESYEDYKNFADNINNFISIVNEQTRTNIPKLKTAQEDWSKASKAITKYSPLINNYNSVILSAKDHKRQHINESYQKFYQEMGKFSLEATFISATLFHQVTFGLVGGVFNSLGIGSLALKCPTCASTIMSGAYWTIKTVLVESASQSADWIFEKLGYKQHSKKEASQQ